MIKILFNSIIHYVHYKLIKIILWSFENGLQSSARALNCLHARDNNSLLFLFLMLVVFWLLLAANRVFLLALGSHGNLS